jgi:adenosylcobinamide-GDP ribazoletransferase
VGFLTALRFLTILPVPLGREADSERVGRSLLYFPLIGLLLGLLMAGLDWALERVLPVSVSSGILLVFLVLITGATHLDGFIDTCDGMVAGKTPQQRWEIMRDSRVGAFGVVGACCLLLLMYVSLANLPETPRTWALVLVPVLGRWAVVCAIWAFRYAKPEGLGRVFKDQATWWMVALATVVALAVSVATLRLTGLAVMFGVGTVSLLLCVIFKRKFAGLTGDTYGAVIVMGELTSLILVIAVPSWSW